VHFYVHLWKLVGPGPLYYLFGGFYLLFVDSRVFGLDLVKRLMFWPFLVLWSPFCGAIVLAGAGFF